LINQAVELRRGGPEASDNLALRERTGADSLLGLDGELVEQRITKEARILVVFEDLLDMYGPLFPGFQNVGNPSRPSSGSTKTRAIPLSRVGSGLTLA